MPLSGTPASVTLDISAATGGRKFVARAVATTTRFHQDATLAAFCKAYSVPDSTLYNADLSYQKHLSSAAQWQHSRSEGAFQLGTLADATSTPGWAANTVGAIRTAVLTAAPGTSSQADSKDTRAIATACQNNSSTLTVQVTVPNQG